MKTKGEIEAEVCAGISRFEQEYMGRGPKDIRAHLIGDHIAIFVHGVLTAPERQLALSKPPDSGRTLLKSVRTQLIEMAKPVLEVLIEGITGVKILSLHHDVSTLTGEQVIVFTLISAPEFRETTKRR